MVHQTDACGLSTVDQFASQNQFTSAFVSDYSRQHQSSDRGKHTKLDLRLTKACSLTRDHNVASRDQFTTTTECRTLNQRNRRSRQLFELTEDAVKRVEHLIDGVWHVLFNGHTGTKRPRALLRRKNNCDYLPQLREGCERAANLAYWRGVENVQRRSRERNWSYAIVDVEFDVLVGVGASHCWLLMVDG